MDMSVGRHWISLALVHSCVRDWCEIKALGILGVRFDTTDGFVLIGLRTLDALHPVL